MIFLSMWIQTKKKKKKKLKKIKTCVSVNVRNCLGSQAGASIWILCLLKCESTLVQWSIKKMSFKKFSCRSILIAHISLEICYYSEIGKVRLNYESVWILNCFHESVKNVIRGAGSLEAQNWALQFRQREWNEFWKAILSVNTNATLITTEFCILLQTHCILQVYTEQYRHGKTKQRKRDESKTEFLKVFVSPLSSHFLFPLLYFYRGIWDSANNCCQHTKQTNYAVSPHCNTVVMDDDVPWKHCKKCSLLF